MKVRNISSRNGEARQDFRFLRGSKPNRPRSATLRALQWLTLLFWLLPAFSQTPSAPVPASPPTESGSIRGTVVDKDGATIPNARVALAEDGSTSTREVLSGSDGGYVFAGVAPGPFQITFNATGFAFQVKSGVLHARQDYIVPDAALPVGAAVVDVEVRIKPEEIAEDQIQVQEKQRIFGAIPNFYVSYVPNAVPLTSRQKFELAWKSIIDPVSFGITGAIAGVEQLDNAYGAYGQGAQGYGKRFGAAYADLVSGTFIGGAILPSLLKQDPRYFYKGTGTRKSRFFYAVASSVMCKGDNGRWQPNYSGIIGGLAAGGISNLYYPDADRNGARLTFENTLIGTGEGAVVNIIQEFILRKITPHTPGQDPAKP